MQLVAARKALPEHAKVRAEVQKAVYAARRTMPNGLGRSTSVARNCRAESGADRGTIRHSLMVTSAVAIPLRGPETQASGAQPSLACDAPRLAGVQPSAQASSSPIRACGTQPLCHVAKFRRRSRMPESGTSGSVGTAGERSPAVTRPRRESCLSFTDD